MIKNKGYCVCCDQETIFESEEDWLRDNYRCRNCMSIPRHRALIRVIEMFYPNWREFIIHESSSNNSPSSLKLKNHCKEYISSQFLPDKKFGDIFDGVHNIDLEKKHLKKNSLDLVVTQDVFEHVYRPDKAIKNIYRTLKKGGAHICTVPLVNKDKPTEKWSKMVKGEILWMGEPEYHGNPVAENSPVSFHYGYDLPFLIQKWSKFNCTMVFIETIDLGIKAEYNEVLIMRKE